MRSIGSDGVDDFADSAFFAVLEAGWPERGEVAGCWACKARTGTRHVSPITTVVWSKRRMGAGLLNDTR
jgi:hypothetical protein